MATDRTKWFQRVVWGSPWDKNVCKVSYGYTHTFKKVAAASTTAVHAAITSAFSAQTVTTGITNPDVPRVLTVTPGGTAANIGNGVVTVTGTNVEGKVITDTFQLVDGNTTTITGKKAFKTVTSIALPAMEGTAATVAVGYSNGLGLNHRLYDRNTTVKVVQDTGSARTMQATAPTITDADEQYIEKNIVTPATAPDGTTFLTIYYIFDHWTLNDLNDEPKYQTSTSTSSTSTSTSTSTFTTSTSSTSTSSTSQSTSSTSSSTSSTSSSTSSTSTSTTTVP